VDEPITTQAVIDKASSRQRPWRLSIVVFWLAIAYAVLTTLLLFLQGTDLVDRPFAHTIITRVSRNIVVPVWHESVFYPFLFGAFFAILTYELLIKKRMALYILSAFVLAAGAVDILGRTDVRAGVISICMAILFLFALPYMPGVPDPSKLRISKRIALVAIPLLLVFGIVGLFLGSNPAPTSRNPLVLVKHSFQVAVGQSPISFHGWHDVYKFAFILSFILLFTALLYLLFSSHISEPGHSKEEEEVAREILGLFGGDSLAYFNTRGEKSYFFSGDDCFIAYMVIAGVAVMSADPVGPVERQPQALQEFKQFCTKSGWRMSGIGVSEEVAGFLRPMGLKSACFGEESVIGLESFSLEGRKMRKLRQSVNGMERAGYRVEFMFNAGIPHHLKYQLLDISKAWRGDSPETGYSMGLGRLLSSDDPDCLLALAYGEGLDPVGFLYLVPMYPDRGYSLDITRMKEDVPGALSDFMITQTALYLKERGHRHISLHFLALSQHYREDSDEKTNLFWKMTTWFLNRHFPAVNSYRFDKKYDPAWVRRYIVYPSIFEVVRCIVSIVAAESALKLTKPESHKAVRAKT
jgi:lysyl-tRNA synthetase class 2